jgi:hypothetical protein
MYILVPEESGGVKTNTYYEGGWEEWQGRVGGRLSCVIPDHDRPNTTTPTIMPEAKARIALRNVRTPFATTFNTLTSGNSIETTMTVC